MKKKEFTEEQIVSALKQAYDAENRQTQAVDNVSEGQASYGYDGLGQRVTKSNNGLISTLYVYDIFGQLAAEYNSFPKQQSPCSTCYLSYDHLGSLRLVTDNSTSANIIARHDYLPFGEEIPANAVGRRSEWGPFGDKVNQKFTGQERDEETGFDFFQARYFYGAQGRFNSPDPGNAGADPMNPQTWNGYSYVRNNPLAYVDPSGFCTVVSFGVGDKQGQYDSTVPASAAVYPFDAMGKLGGIGSVLSQGYFGPNQSTQTLANAISQYQNIPDGIQLALYSGSAQTFVTGANSGAIDTSNITSVTYLSPGLAPGQGLVSVGDTTAFRGSGLVDFAVTLPARLNSGGIGIQSLGPGTGHSFLNEYNSRRVQATLAGGTPCGTTSPPALRMPPPPSIRAPFGGAGGFGGWDEFDLLQLINKLPSPPPIET
jgi:RHS repeat-associated protein